MDREYYVYIMTNEFNSVLYTGVTGNLWKRVREHQTKFGGDFTRKYRVNKLVYAECYSEVEEAIAREKQIKSGLRLKKIALINSTNPDWKDISTT